MASKADFIGRNNALKASIKRACALLPLTLEFDTVSEEAMALKYRAPPLMDAVFMVMALSAKETLGVQDSNAATPPC